MSPLADREDGRVAELLARQAELERENHKLKRINAALIERVESSGAGRDASYAAFQHSVELAEQVRERTDALNQAMAELKGSNQLLSDARLRAETAHQHLVDAIESISDAFVLFDRDQRIVLFNRRFKSLWTRTRARINAGTRLAEVRRMAESTGLIVEEHRGKGDEPTVYRLNNGRWVQVSERPTREGGLVILYTDITEVKVSETMRREQALAQKSRLLQRAVDNLSQGVAMVSAEGALELWNRRFLELCGLAPIEAHRPFEEVMADQDCPPLYHHGLGHIGPVIMQFGTARQKAQFLPRILDTTDWWCQGYSEPGSGSDLASLSTPAVRDGDHYVINGQKIWTSHAHEADRIYLLARTSREGRKQEGISLFLIDMDTPGIRVRPIPTIDGWHHVNEVFLDDVRVPADRLLGEEGKGWTCAKYLLERERLPPASVAQLMRQWRRVARLLNERRQAAPLHDYAALDDEMLALAARIKGAREMLAQAIDAMMRKEPLDARPSALKQACSVISQSLTRIAFMAVGDRGTQRLLREDEGDSPDGTWVQNYLFARSKTIAGGTTEVQLNVVARSLFGS